MNFCSGSPPTKVRSQSLSISGCIVFPANLPHRQAGSPPLQLLCSSQARQPCPCNCHKAEAAKPLLPSLASSIWGMGKVGNGPLPQPLLLPSWGLHSRGESPQGGGFPLGSLDAQDSKHRNPAPSPPLHHSDTPPSQPGCAQWVWERSPKTFPLHSLALLGNKCPNQTPHQPPASQVCVLGGW